MIVVTGTKRSGTSMWMQVLVGAGFPFVGRPFPAGWKESIGAANPEGFFESRWRRGVFGPAERDPGTGQPICAEEFRHHAVKIFVQGVLRTEERHLHRVIASVRNFREYEDSRRRMWQMEDDAHRKTNPNFQPPARMDPLYEWWTANYALLVDGLKRRYPLKLIAYDTMLDDPERTIRGVLAWIGGGDLTGALAAVKPQHRTQRAYPSQQRRIESNVAAVFDELYETIRQGSPLRQPLVSKLETVNRLLLPRVKAEAARVTVARQARSARDEDRGTSHDHDSELDQS